MRLLAKFNLLFLSVFGTGLVAAGYFANQFLQTNAREQVVEQARLMMEAASSMRDYTSHQIAPLLATEQIHKRNFLSETVPAFAATESFGFIRKRYPDYSYKEATLNPTNLRDRAVDWEADIINEFRNRKEQTEIFGDRGASTGRSLFLARPIVADPPCLECHSTPAAAPPAMIRHYGKANGFGWQPNEIVGAQIVSVPMALPINIAKRAFGTLLVASGALCLLALLVLNAGLVFTVIRPATQLSRMADEISKGNLELPELPVKGKDEIATLASAFNRMRQSLVKALRMLAD